MSANIDKIAAGNANLLLLAEILEEADARHIAKGERSYDQSTWMHTVLQHGDDDEFNVCHTPACAMGHWWAHRGRELPNLPYTTAYRTATQDFAVDDEGFAQIFDAGGCAGARTAKDAATYIRSFVARRNAQP